MPYSLLHEEKEGSITLVHQDRRESFNLRYGDILRIPAGTTVYLINKSNNEKLVIIKLLQPVSIPGHFEAFFGPGGENPESYFSAFSSSLLEAALNVSPIVKTNVGFEFFSSML
ncbi:hypothetical protein ACSBR2_021119 [Camellia fascicularis]